MKIHKGHKITVIIRLSAGKWQEDDGNWNNDKDKLSLEILNKTNGFYNSR